MSQLISWNICTVESMFVSCDIVDTSFSKPYYGNILKKSLILS